MRSSYVRVLLIAATMAHFTTACDDDSSGGSAGPTTSVPADKTLSSLTDAELTQLNKDMGSYMAQQMSTSIDKNTACEGMGVMMAAALGLASGSGTPPTDASLQEMCNSTASQCKQSNEPPETGGNEPSELERSQLTDCSATVAEYQKCMQDSTNVSISMMKSLPKCADLKAAELEAIFTSSMAVETAQSCESMASKCPGYAADL